MINKYCITIWFYFVGKVVIFVISCSLTCINMNWNKNEWLLFNFKQIKISLYWLYLKWSLTKLTSFKFVKLSTSKVVCVLKKVIAGNKFTCFYLFYFSDDGGTIWWLYVRSFSTKIGKYFFWNLGRINMERKALIS